MSMHVVINAECAVVPEKAKALQSETKALLNLLLCLNYDPAYPPLADLLRQYHQLQGEWLLLSPVHWQATHNDAMIVALGQDLQVKEQDAKFWFEHFSQYLAEEGLALYYHDAQTWLLCTDKKPTLHAKAVHHLLNLSLMPELARMDKSLYWQKLITESQMLFASRPNPTLMNGLWIWGGGTLEKQQKIKICADEHFLSLAQICSSKVDLYHPAINLKEYHLLLINKLAAISPKHQEELTKMNASWYWNNVAYTLHSCNWFARFWRKLIHAY